MQSLMLAGFDWLLMFCAGMREFAMQFLNPRLLPQAVCRLPAGLFGYAETGD
jgi:hypothetical protein